MAARAQQAAMPLIGIGHGICGCYASLGPVEVEFTRSHF
jgi:hypothetical protein